MLKKYSLKRVGIITYGKVNYDGNPLFFLIEDTDFHYESRVWISSEKQNITFINDFGLVIDSDSFNQIVNQSNSTFFDLIKSSKNVKFFRNRKVAEDFAKKHNLPWTPIKTPKGTRYVIITNPPRCCTLDAILYKEPNNPFV